MSGVDAAATLTLKIDTSSAASELAALKKEYQGLRAEMAQKLGTNISSGIQDSVKSLQASLSAVGAGVVSVNKALDDIVRAGGKFTNELVKGARAAVRENDLLTNSYTSISAAASTASKSAVQYNSLMGTAAPAVASLTKANALLTDSYTSISAAASTASKSAVQYNSLMGTAAPAVASLTKSNVLLTDSYTSISAAASTASKSAVQYNSLMGIAAPAVASLARSNALLTDSLVSVGRATSIASKAVVEYDALMGASSPLVKSLSKSNTDLAASNALLTKSYISVADSTRSASKIVAEYDSLMMTASRTSMEAATSNALLTRSYTSVATAATAASKSVVVFNSLLGTDARGSTTSGNTLLTNSLTTVARTAPSNTSSSVGRDGRDALTNSVLPSSVTELEDAHRRVIPAANESAAAQAHWNKIANEGHALARGLAGSLGTLWITYGSLVPLLAGAALGAAFKQTATAGSEFAYQLTFVKALGTETTETMARLSDSAKSLGQNSLQGPVELASGFRILAQAGLQGADSILAMSSVLDLAVVGEMDMAQAGTTLVGVMNAFGLSVTSASHVGDVFAKAAALSQTSVQAMTESMKTASVVSEQYGASLEDTATALTLLAKVNITGTAAGTSLRNMLKELYTPTKQASDTFKQLGLSVSDSQGKLKTFPEIIFELKDKLEGFDKVSQVNILQRMFGERGAKEAIAMLAETRDSWENLNQSISNSSGFIRGVSAELEATTKGTFQQAMNALTTAFVSVFDKTEGPMKDMAIRLKTMFSSEEFKANVAATVVLLGNVASATLSAVSAISTLINLLPDGSSGFALWVAGLTLLIPRVVSLGAAAATAVSAIAGAATGAGAAGAAAAGAASFGFLPLAVAVGAVTAAYLLMNNSTPVAISNINALNAALDTEISRLKLVNTELTRKISLESGNASIESAAVRKEITAGKEKLREYDATLAVDAASKKSGQTTVIGDMLSSIFTTDEKKREGYAKVIEARTKRSELEAKIAKAELNLKIAEGYEDEVRINSSKAQVKELLKQKELDDKLKTGPGKFTPIEGTKVGSGAGSPNRGALKDNRSILNDNLESGLKQEKIQLGRELIDIEVELAAQTISTIVATERKNQATMASLEIERLLIEASLSDAKATGDKVQVEKFSNDLTENSLKLEKRVQQATLDTVKARVADNNAIQDLSISSKRYIEDLEFEQAALDKTAIEVSKLRIEREQLRAVEDLKLRVDQNKVSPEVAEAESAAIAAKAAAQMKDEEFQRRYETGWKKAHKAYVDDAANAAKQGAEAYQIMTNSMESFLDNFLTTGKLGFEDFARSVILSIAKIEARALLASASKGLSGDGGGFGGIVKGILGILGMGGSPGGVTGGTIPGVMTAGIASMIGTSSAKGNVFSGSPSLHAYANTVQTTPQGFAFQNLHGFAKGGVFAEAGPEAVMPLTRDSAGRLGVRAANDGNTINVTVNISGSPTAPDVRRAGGQVARETAAAIRSTLKFA